jgi:multidrug resistance efflux pump
MKKILILILILSMFHERKSIYEWWNDNQEEERILKIAEAEVFVELWKAEVASDENDIAVAAIELSDAKLHLDRITLTYLAGAVSEREYRNILLKYNQAKAQLAAAHIDLRKSKAMLKSKEIDLELAQIGSWSLHFVQPRYTRIR